MFSPQTIEFWISLTITFFAYLFSITLSGNCQAYVASKCGDSTAEANGFTEFNPFLFINFFDIIWFALFHIMIGRSIPIDLTDGIKRHYNWWRTRVFLLFASRSLCNLLIAIIASIASVFICKSVAFQFDAVASAEALKANLSSFSYLMCQFFNTLIIVNIFLATFECCRQIIHFFILYKLEKDFSFIEYTDYLIVFGPLLVWMFFGKQIFYAFVYFINCVVLGISYVCGA